MSSSINIDKSEVGVLEKENFVALNESSEKARSSKRSTISSP